MIFLRLAGGLGNQLFQLGAAGCLSRNFDLPVSIDCSALSSYDTPRNISLDKILDLESFCMNNDPYIDSMILKKRIPKLIGGNFFGNYFINDNNFTNFIEVKKQPTKVFLDGYFNGFVNQNIFNQSVSLLSSFYKRKLSLKKDTCAIHIRGGDFLKLGWDKITQEYYQTATNLVKNQNQNTKFVVYTDDKEYASSIMKTFDVQFSFSDQGIYEDFFNFGSHKYKILSASTFAFWSCALGHNVESINYVPGYQPPFEYLKLLLPNEKRIFMAIIIYNR